MDVAERAQLVEDCRGVRAEIVRRGWAKERLIDLDESAWDEYDDLGRDEAVQRSNRLNSAVCMTGAIGAKLDGADFIEWAVRNAGDTPIEWGFSPRAMAVMNALLEHRPRGTGVKTRSDCDCNSDGNCDNLDHGSIHRVVDINDSFEEDTGQAEILAWLDATIAALTTEKKKRKVVRVAAAEATPAKKQEVKA